MSTYKKIYWREDMEETNNRQEGKMFANVHILVGYNQGRITDYKNMLKELRKDFPEATESTVNCGKVTKSSYCAGFTILRYDAVVPKKKYPDYQECKWENADYYFA